MAHPTENIETAEFDVVDSGDLPAADAIRIASTVVATEGGARTLKIPARHVPRHAAVAGRRYTRKVIRRLRVDPLDDWPEHVEGHILVRAQSVRRWQRRAFRVGAIAAAAGAALGLWVGHYLIAVVVGHALGAAALLIGGGV